MKFSTPVHIPPFPFTIQHQETLMLCGSCFSANIGQKLKQAKLNTCVNPFGIIYNPISLANSFKHIIENHHYTVKELYHHQDKWISWNHHGSFSSTQATTALETINHHITQSNQKLKKLKTIILTLGSAWVYEWKETGQIVANCHKLPSSSFTKRLLKTEEVVKAISEIMTCLPQVNFVLTVSPVRHIKDGLYENNLSKSVLHSAVNDIINQHKNGFYFPAYELVIDELRDYRFYKEDMVHPNQQAIDYVWEKFSSTFFNQNTTELIQKIEKVQNAAQHQPFNFDSDQHQTFIKKQLSIMDEIEQQNPSLHFKNERDLLMQMKK